MRDHDRRWVGVLNLPLAQIGAGSIEPLYLVTGDDESEMSAIATALTESIDDDFRAFNVQRFYGSDSGIRLAAVLSKNIDATLISPLQGRYAEKLGLTVISVPLPYIWGINLTRKSYLEKNRPIVKAYLAALAESVRTLIAVVFMSLSASSICCDALFCSVIAPSISRTSASVPSICEGSASARTAASSAGVPCMPAFDCAPAACGFAWPAGGFGFSPV